MTRSLGAALLTLCLVLPACASQRPAGPGTVDAQATTGEERSGEELCLDGVHRSPRSSIRVHRATVAPLARVKDWVLSGGGIDWDEFSSHLARAPLDERVAVCVLTKRDGSRFDIPSGEGPSGPAQSVVVIVRPGGASTLFMVGSLRSMLDTTPRTFADRPRLI